MSEKERGCQGALDRWWVRLLVAGWVVAIITVYFWRQIQRVLEIAGPTP
jgi:hypothetical protein